MNKNIIIIIIAAVIFGGVGFFGGIQYQKSKGVLVGPGAGNFRNMSDEQRQQAVSQFGGSGNTSAQNKNARIGGGGFVSGEILSQDDKSITIKLPDGGSKIVFFSDSTEINKSVVGNKEDLQTGKTASIMGETNQDGSINAKTIQVK